MGVSRGKGFTLIELLVVIAIIGILASMVFPVFARARESARKAVCLSNVKNIALAIQMYLADNNDTFWPAEHRQEVKDFYAASPGAAGRIEDCGDVLSNLSNPYLRAPVLLDEYLKNRDVWRCPSARTETGAHIITPGPDWFGHTVANAALLGEGGDQVCVASPVFPPGWGGAVTDSWSQLKTAGGWAIAEATGRESVAEQAPFRQSISTNSTVLRDMKMVEIDDPVKWVVCGDAGARWESMTPGLLAYPDLCNVECANWWCSGSWIGDPACQPSIQAGCPERWECYVAFHADPTMLKDQSLLAKRTRHLGGTNIGFADGHAAWWNSARLLDTWADETGRRPGVWPKTAMGLEAWGHYSWVDCYGCWPADEPTLR